MARPGAWVSVTPGGARPRRGGRLVLWRLRSLQADAPTVRVIGSFASEDGGRGPVPRRRDLRRHDPGRRAPGSRTAATTRSASLPTDRGPFAAR